MSRQSFDDVMERRQRVERLIRENTGMSDAALAREVGVDDRLVRGLRQAILAGDSTADKRTIVVPEGKVFSELCAQGVELEEGGMVQKDVVKDLGLSELAYRAGRDMIYLLKNPRLPEEHRERVAAVLREMDETKRVMVLYTEFIPLLNRMFGRERITRNWRRQEKVVQDYMYAVTCVSGGADALRSLDVPFLSTDEYRLVKQSLLRAQAGVREALKRLKGDHQ